MQGARPKYFSESDRLTSTIASEDFPSGHFLTNDKIEIIKEELSNLPQQELQRALKLYFKDLAISSHTLKALERRGFSKLTEIQRCVIPHALKGRDILASSRTGSGKTLSYLVPLIECLYREKWTSMDGLGAMVVLPTRELAVQVSEVLRSLVDGIRLSHGLITGGKSLEAERKALLGLNIVVCTPGRLVQHLGETTDFELTNLKFLVFDEADEIFSQGFAATVDEILRAVPPAAQTLLLSATLSPEVLKLARVSLKSPEQIFLGLPPPVESSRAPSRAALYDLPVRLRQFYLISPYHDKLDVLFSFLKAHSTSKTLVFVNTCKQVRLIYEGFRRLRVGLPLFELHGRQAQAKRTAIFFSFAESKRACLVTTNVAARGLDFPKIDWVVQLDCPDSVETYVHRVGRTARYAAAGSALMVLDPSEAAALERIKPLQPKQIFPNNKKQFTIKKSLQALCSEDPDLKYLAQRAFISFMKSLHHMTDKAVFSVEKVAPGELARSFGLEQTPVLRLGNNILSDSTPLPTADYEDLESLDSDHEQEPLNTSTAQQLNTSTPQPVKTSTPIDLLSAPLTKAQRKLQKLKEKIALKSEKLRGKSLEPDSIEQKNITDRLNELRENPTLARSEKIVFRDNADSSEPLLLQKRERTIDPSALKIDPFKIPKNRFKKIRPEGPFDQRNVFDIDDEGNFTSLAQKRHSSNYGQQAEHHDAQPNEDLVEKYARKLRDNHDVDRKNQIEKIREKREKVKTFVKANEAEK